MTVVFCKRAQADAETTGHLRAITDEPDTELPSVFSVSDGDEAEEPPPPERPANVAQAGRRKAAAYAAQHPGRDDEVRPLTANERRMLRRDSNHLVNFRVCTTTQDGAAPTLT